MSSDDPSRLVIKLELRSFFSLMSMVIDNLLHDRLPLRQFRPLLAPRTTLIRDAGHPELAQAIADDLDHLEAKLQRLQELRAAGVSSYVAARADARLEVWRKARVFTGFEVQMQRERVGRIETVVAEASSSLSHIHSCVAVSEGRIAQLRRELQVEEENMRALELTRLNKEEALTTASRELELSRQKLAEVEEIATRTLNIDEESFRAELQGELCRAYDDDLSQLEQQILCHKLDV